MANCIKSCMRGIFSTEESGGIGRNVTYAFFAQGIALLSGFVMTLIVPKMLGVTEYAHWQLFLFYAGYVAVTMLGVGDGLYLRLGGMRYTQLNYAAIKTEYCAVALSQLMVAMLIWIGSWFLHLDVDLRFVLFSVLLYLVMQNAYGFIAPVFQAVNLTRIYSMGAVVSKTVFVAILVLLLVAGVRTYEPIAIAYIIGVSTSLTYCLICARDILRVKPKPLSRELRQICEDVRIGLRVMVAYYASSLIVGVAQQVIVLHWGLETFGQLSFAFSLISFVLVFIAQFSMVLFPVLRRLDLEQLKERYEQIRDFIYIVAPLCYLLYIPASYILIAWLPDYRESVTYLGILMPMFVFDGETNMLYSTYLKVYGDTKHLLCFNLLALAVSFIAASVGAFVFNSVRFVVYGLLCAIMLRSVLCGGFLAVYRLHCEWLKRAVAECCLAVLFVLSIAAGNLLVSLATSVIGYILLVVASPESLISVVTLLKGILGRNNAN